VLEIIALIILCNKNAKNAKERGKSGGAAVAYTLGLWIGMEILGAFIGGAAPFGSVAYVRTYAFALLFAIVGGAASYFIAKSGTPVSKQETNQPPAASDKIYRESDNRGMLIETMSQSTVYWMVERASNPRKDPFVMYTFNNEADAKAAMLSLPFIHLASDTNRLICDHHLFRYGYYAVNESAYEAFIAGADLTHDMWKKIHDAFKAHRGMEKNDLEPEESANQTAAPASGNLKNVRFVRENRDGPSVWKTHAAPSKADAMAFLSQQNITQPLYYVVVETPEGNFGKDKNGFYQE
jgi:hypothetical protein